MINELIQIIDELRKVIKQTELNIPDETLFVQALTCARTPNFIYSQEQKKEPIENKPTDKQIKYLKDNMDWQGELPKTKEKAHEIISNYINNLKKENI